MSTDIDKTPDTATARAPFTDWAKIADDEVRAAVRDVDRATKKIAEGRDELTAAKHRLAVAERAAAAVAHINRPTPIRPTTRRRNGTKENTK